MSVCLRERGERRRERERENGVCVWCVRERERVSVCGACERERGVVCVYV